MFHSVLREEEALRLRALSYCLLTVSGMSTPEEPVDVDGGSADVEDDATETETAQGNAAVDAANNAGEEVEGQPRSAVGAGATDGRTGPRRPRDPDGPMTATMAALQALREAVRALPPMSALGQRMKDFPFRFRRVPSE